MRHPTPARALLCALLVALAAPVGAAGPIEVVDAYARAVPTVATTSAAFMTIRNNGVTDRRLLAVHSDAADSVELHSHEHVDGVMRMRRIDGIALPAGAQVQLAPGGLHVMLIGLTRPLDAAGQTISLELEFADGTRKTIQAPVVAP